MDPPNAAHDHTDPPRPPGWDAEWERAWSTADDSTGSTGLVPSRVTRIDKGGITVATRAGDDHLVIAAKGARRVVVGDVCALDDEAGRIESILPRRTVFERRSPGVNRDELRLESQPVAANMDTVFVLQPLDPGINLSRLARELVLAWESGARPVVVLTKADLVPPPEIEWQVADARRFAPDVEVCVVTTRVDDGIAPVEQFVGNGHLVALLGASGAGKSSLVNALAGDVIQLTTEVREGDRRGRHTTSAGQLVQLRAGGLLIDTPGIRGVGLWASDDGLERAFADLAPYAEDCRFTDCRHESEPGCGILAAVERGDVAADRLEVWHQLVAELESLEDDLEVRDRALERQVNQRARGRARDRRPS